MAIKRAISIEEIEKRKFIDMEFTDKWALSFGIPERSGIWLIWGHSGNGKTRFSLQLAKYLTRFGKVAYNTLEEGARKSMQKAVIETGLREVARNIILLDREPIGELANRLRRRRSPDICIIDSFQYTGMTRSDYIALKEEFNNKLFVFISHADGRHPEGRTAKFIRYDADIKIHIEGYKAFPTSRYGGGEPFVIWDLGAEKYWGGLKSN